MPTSASSAAGSLNVEQAVRDRYTAASQAAEPALCCPVQYDRQYLEILPAELIERDYGCGDPSRHVAPGETVLDLGSGGGKICYIAAQVVGAAGRVIGVDMNNDMLALARKHQQPIGDQLGYHNVEFHKGKIQDLALNYDRFDAWLREHPVRTADDWLAATAEADRLRSEEPLIESDSVDVVVSNCVLNLVREEDRRRMFAEIHRVLRRGGRAVISDIVSDEPVPAALRNNPELWSGCISGAYVESELLAAFVEAGCYGVEIMDRQEEPWAVVEGIEFRSLTVRAYKGKEGPCLDHHQAVIYRGPWKSVTDDDGHTLHRGQRMAVCEKTFQIYNRAPYAEQILPVPPNQPLPTSQIAPFDCRRNAVRDPRETKGGPPAANQLPGASLPVLDASCSDDGKCC